MRLIVITAVYQRTKSCDHLNHGHIKVLSEAVGCQIGGAHILRHVDQAGCPRLPRQVYIGPESEIKDILKFTEILFPHQLRNLHHGHIAGRGYGIFQGHMALCMTSDGISPDLHHAGTLKAGVRRHRSLFQRRSHRKRFCCRTGFIGIGNAIVFPQIIQIQIQLVTFHGIYHILVNDRIRLLDLIIPVGIRNLLHHSGSDHGLGITGVVQVVGGITGHGNDLPRVGIHHDAAHILRAVSCANLVLMLIIELLQILFHYHLQIGINGGVNVVSVHCRLHRALHCQVIIQIAVLSAVNPI